MIPGQVDPKDWPDGATPCRGCKTGYRLYPYSLCWLCNHPEERAELAKEHPELLEKPEWNEVPVSRGDAG